MNQDRAGGFCLATGLFPGFQTRPSVTFRDIVFIRPSEHLVGGWKTIGRDNHGDAQLELAATDTWVFEVDAENDIADVLEVGGRLEVNDSRLDVRLLQGDLEARDSFDLLVVEELGGEFAEIDLPKLSNSLQWNTTDLFTDGSISVTFRGDFDNSGALDPTDVDLLSEAIEPGIQGILDLTGDGMVDIADRGFWVTELAGTFFGDANLDRQVDFTDFLLLSSSFSKSGSWAMGDFDGDGDVAFADFLVLSENFGASSASVATVPEPSCLILVLLGIASRLGLRQRAVSLARTSSR